MDVLLFLPVLLFSVIVHEVAHAQVALWEGDDTAQQLGRITLNPLPHLDLFGSILVPLLLFFLPGDLIFGWAKPVPVRPYRFRDPKWGDVRVSLAGVAANFVLAFLSTVLLAGLLKLEVWLGPGGRILPALQTMASFGIWINLILAVFNLIPIPPLDGSHVVGHLLPPPLAARYREVGRYGLGIVMMLVFFFPGSLELLLRPVRWLLSAADLFIGLWL